MTAAPPPAQDGVLIGLSAVVMALKEGEATALLIHGEGGEAPALPFGPFDPSAHRTFELALRDFVEAQTGLPLGYVEQLYTFGDAGRDLPRAEMGAGARRVVSIGYLALARRAEAPERPDARWTRLIDCFPWEDWRKGRPSLIDDRIAPALRAWAGGNTTARARVDALFALSGLRWNEERVLDRYELLYEAGLVPESARDHGRSAAEPLPGLALASDHRRILATGLGRLRAKLKYRPVLFDLMGDRFTLSELQRAAEAVAGLKLHKQNFRRGVERAGMVEPTGTLSNATRGRPAELFRQTGADAVGHAPGLSLPAAR